jgi:hypothetical protein
MASEVFVVVETSPVGETVIGAFSTIEKARTVLPRHDTAKLQNYRVEFHVIDEPVLEEQAWTVRLSRDGATADVSPVILCNCGDDHDALENTSYIEGGGARMHVVVWATTKGGALDAAERYRAWLIEELIWGDQRLPIRPISAGRLAQEPVEA